MEFGDRLKWARDQSCFHNQKEVAKVLGVEQTTYSRWENGRIKSTSHILKLAEVLGVNANWLASGEGVPFDDAKKRVGAQDVELINDRLSVLERRLAALEHQVTSFLGSQFK